MHKFQSLTKYISLIPKEDVGEWIIDKENDGTMEHPIHLPFVEYSDVVYQFVTNVYAFCDEHPEFDLYEYEEILKNNGIKWNIDSMCDADVSGKDERCILALIVGAVRAERFCDGALMDFLAYGSIKKWLTRLQEIDGEKN